MTTKDNEKSRKRGAEDEALSLLTRTGGAYIPPAKLRALQARVTDKSSPAYQRIAWEALKKTIHGLINKVNGSNIRQIVRQLFGENLFRGRGLLARSIIVAQSASPIFTHVYAALVAIINAKFPAIGELICKRLLVDFRKAFKRNNKEKCLASSRFLGHLFNQRVVHEILPLEIAELLLSQPTNDSVEIAVAFLKEVSAKLTEVSPRCVNTLFDRLRAILNEAGLDKRVQYMIEVMFQVRRDGFKDNPAVVAELDLIEEDDQFTHMLLVEDDHKVEEDTNVFRFDPEYEANEEKYDAVRQELMGESGDSSSSGSGSGDESSEEEDDADKEETAEGGEKAQTIQDNTETNLVRLRRTIYLTIQSSLGFEEAAHKLSKLEIKPGQEYELCNMIMDCCAQLRTFEKFYGLLAERFARLQRKYVEEFEKIFAEQYNTIHRLETVKLRNVAKFFGHLLYTDAISWGCLQVIRLNEEDTTSSSRIFLKILFQELCEFMGIVQLNERLRDATLQCFFAGLLPRDNPRNTRFAINFFTAIGLGGLTVDLRKFLQEQPPPSGSSKGRGGNRESDSSDSSSEESSSSSSSEESSTSSSEDQKKSKKKKTTKKYTEKTEKKKEKKTANNNRQKQKKKDNTSDDDDNERYVNEARKGLEMYKTTAAKNKKLERQGDDLDEIGKKRQSLREKDHRRSGREEKKREHHGRAGDKDNERNGKGDRREHSASTGDDDNDANPKGRPHVRSAVVNIGPSSFWNSSPPQPPNSQPVASDSPAGRGDCERSSSSTEKRRRQSRDYRRHRSSSNEGQGQNGDSRRHQRR